MVNTAIMRRINAIRYCPAPNLSISFGSAIASSNKVARYRIQLEEEDYQRRVSGPGHGQPPGERSPKRTGVRGAAPDCDKDPNRICRETQLHHFLQINAAVVDCAQAHEGERRTYQNTIAPKHFAQGEDAIPRAYLRLENSYQEAGYQRSLSAVRRHLSFLRSNKTIGHRNGLSVALSADPQSKPRNTIRNMTAASTVSRSTGSLRAQYFYSDSAFTGFAKYVQIIQSLGDRTKEVLPIPQIRQITQS